MRAKFNQRKKKTLEYFATRGWTYAPRAAVDLGVYPTRAEASYLLRLHRWGLLYRARDRRGRVIYRLSPRGARWLLRRVGRV